MHPPPLTTPLLSNYIATWMCGPVAKLLLPQLIQKPDCVVSKHAQLILRTDLEPVVLLSINELHANSMKVHRVNFYNLILGPLTQLAH